MRQRKFIGLLIVLTAFLSACTAQNTGGSIDLSNKNLRVAEISLPGMFCAGCAQSSESAFKGMNGVLDADIRISTKTGTVLYDSGIITKEQLLQDGLIQAYEGRIINDHEYEE